jgi:hypothetical protein
MTSAERKIIEDVETHGWHVINVLPEDPHPPHSFSIGLGKTFDHPEIVVVGLRGETAQVFINDIGQRVRQGELFEPGRDYSDLARGFPVRFVAVLHQHFSEYLGWALWFYRGKTFSAIQMVWPDRDGAFPWDAIFAQDLRLVQPVLNGVI